MTESFLHIQDYILRSNKIMAIGNQRAFDETKQVEFWRMIVSYESGQELYIEYPSQEACSKAIAMLAGGLHAISCA